MKATEPLELTRTFHGFITPVLAFCIAQFKRVHEPLMIFGGFAEMEQLGRGSGGGVSMAPDQRRAKYEK